MKISLCLENLSADPNADHTRAITTAAATSLVNSLLGQMTASEECITEFVIADESQFGDAIHTLQLRAGIGVGYTHNNLHHTVGKTIESRTEDGRITSAVVIRDTIWTVILNTVLGKKELERWPYDAQFALSIVAHELGHCKDNFLRDDPSNTSLLQDGQFSVRQISRYYGSILFGEFAACAHSNEFSSDEVNKRWIETWHFEVGQLLGGIESERKELLQDDSKLDSFAFRTAGAFWLVLIQYAKLIASEINNPAFSPSPPWIENNPEIVEILDDFAKSLRAMWIVYPKWGDAKIEHLFRAWDRMAKAHGYAFVETPQGNALCLPGEWKYNT